MPSCSELQLRTWLKHMQDVVQAQDWERVQQLDALLANWLRDEAPVDAALQSLWREVQAVHAQSLQACQAAKADAAQKLSDLQNNQEAQKAYAWQEILA